MLIVLSDQERMNVLTSQPRRIKPTIPILMHHTTSDVSQDSQGSGSEKSDSSELVSFSFIRYSSYKPSFEYRPL
jgi:protein required for attachment to host cells